MIDIITLAGGCFWCTEAIYKRIKGVTDVTPGYTGGVTKNPDYKTVSSGTTGHAEAIQIKFNPSIISLEKLLEIFFATHDPTTRNRQGADIGSQYRSAVFYHHDSQKEIILREIKKLNIAKKFSKPIITEVTKASSFYKAEVYHLNFYDTNMLAPYCQIVIDPKIKKLLENYSTEVKQEYK